MKAAFAVALGMTLLTACGDGRYQIASGGDAKVWRVDTRSGEVSICVFVQERLRCSQSLAELRQ